MGMLMGVGDGLELERMLLGVGQGQYLVKDNESAVAIARG